MKHEQSSQTLRVAYARLSQESNFLSPLRTTFEDFVATHFFEGLQLHMRTRKGKDEVDGFVKNAELSGFVQWLDRHAPGKVHPVPLFSAWAIPGGPIERATFDRFTAILRSSIIEAGRIDAIYLCLHGAMCAEQSVHPEVLILRETRKLVGPTLPICISLDLHAQLTPEIFELADIVIGYKTNPHRDHAQVGKRAAKLLSATTTGELKPATQWRSLPMLTGGGTTVDFLPSMRPVYRRIRQIERDPRVLDASVFNGHIWHGSSALGWGVVVTTDNNPALAARLADELADLLWQKRLDRPPKFPNAYKAIELVQKSTLLRKLGTICMCDASDVVGAGATGENTNLLRAFIDRGATLVTYLPLRAPTTVEQLWHAPLDTTCNFSVGGQLDPAHSPVLHCQGRIIKRRQHPALGKIVVVQMGTLFLVMTEGPPIAMAPAFYTELDLNIWHADVVVVKSFFPFRLYFAAFNRKTIYVKTHGITDFDVIDAKSQTDPVYPLSNIQSWREVDARRRKLSHKRESRLERFMAENRAPPKPNAAN